MLKLTLAVLLLPVFGFAQGPFSDPWQPLGSRVHLGALVGTSLTSDVRTQDFFGLEVSGNRQIIVGPTIEFDLGRQFAIEFDALYRPIQAETKLRSISFDVRSSMWEFPILAKKYFPIRNWRPFVAGGPTFRYTGDFIYESHYGVTAAAGADFLWRKLHITPSVRYTHWGAAEYGIQGLYRNQSAFLLGFSF